MLAAEKERDTTAHITNLNEDSMLSGVIHHLIKEGQYVNRRRVQSKLQSNDDVTTKHIFYTKSLFGLSGETI